MAVIQWTPVEPPTGEDMPSGVEQIQWASMANGDTGQPYIAPHYPDKTVQVHGTFGVGGNARIQGTLEVSSPTNWQTLSDPNGNDLNFDATKVTTNGKGVETILENVQQIRPNITAGDGTTSLTVRLQISTVARR